MFLCKRSYFTISHLGPQNCVSVTSVRNLALLLYTALGWLQTVLCSWGEKNNLSSHISQEAFGFSQSPPVYLGTCLQHEDEWNLIANYTFTKKNVESHISSSHQGHSYPMSYVSKGRQLPDYLICYNVKIDIMSDIWFIFLSAVSIVPLSTVFD